jgi:hypothetical protein
LSGGSKTFSTTTRSKSPFSRTTLRIVINTDAELLINKKVNQLQVLLMLSVIMQSGAITDN